MEVSLTYFVFLSKIYKILKMKWKYLGYPETPTVIKEGYHTHRIKKHFKSSLKQRLLVDSKH